MSISRQFFPIALIFISTVLVSAQSSKNDQNNPNIQQSERDRIAEQQRRRAADRQERNTEQVLATRAEIGNVELPPGSVSEETRARAAEAARYKKTFEKIQKPPFDYQSRFGQLLRDKKANLVRLYPDKKCDLLESNVVYAVDLDRCRDVVPVAGGGSRYSFKQKSNYRFGISPADIHFSEGQFIAGNDFARGVIADFGDVDLLGLDLNSQVLSFVKSFKPQPTTAELTQQNRLLEKGFSSNGIFYAGRAAVKLNSTYVMRAIAYQRYETNPALYRVTGKLSRPLNDVLVAFKVVGIEPDGSVVLLWKKLD